MTEPNRPSIVYLATPYSHPDPAVMEWRYQCAVRAAASLMRDGCVVFSPIAHSHEIGKLLRMQTGGKADPDVHRFWMRQDLPWLAQATVLMVLTLPGWEHSHGVGEEIEFARQHDIDISYHSYFDITREEPPAMPDDEGLRGAMIDGPQEVLAALRGEAPSTDDYITADEAVDEPWLSQEAIDYVDLHGTARGEQIVFHANVPGSKDTNPKDAVGTRKAPMSTVPSNVLAEIGVGMLEGARKYGRHNYRVAGIRASVYYDAAMRHLMAWWEGEDTDPDSGVSHIAKALCTLVVLRDAQMQGMCTDDRPPRSRPFYGELNARAGEVIDRYADRAPRHYTILDDDAQRYASGGERGVA